MSLVTMNRTFAGYEALNLNTVGSWVSIDVGEFTFVSVGVMREPGSYSWGTASVVIQRSADGINFFGFATAVSVGAGASSGTTFTSGVGGVTGILDVSGYKQVRAYVGTAEPLGPVNETSAAAVTFMLKQTNTTAAASGAVSP